MSSLHSNTHSPLFSRRRSPTARYGLPDLWFRFHLFSFCRNTNTTTGPSVLQDGVRSRRRRRFPCSSIRGEAAYSFSKCTLLVTRSACVFEISLLQQHNRNKQCDCCFETFSSKKIVQLPGCGHVYCADCLRVIYRMAINNEANFPPSCCSGAIDIKSVNYLLHRPQIQAFERRALEYNTPETDRRYCADSRCNSFLGRASHGILRCGKCGNLTCDSCKDYAHTGACKEERGRDVHKLDKDLEQLAAAEGWQRCPSCSRVVALSEGCNHITLVVSSSVFSNLTDQSSCSCLCKHQFCYVCGAKWKTCACKQWQAARLQERLRQGERNVYLRPPELEEERPYRGRLLLHRIHR